MFDSFDQVPLGELFEIVRGSICPFLFPDEEFVHHSLPAFDKTGSFVVQYGREIESNKTLLVTPVVLLSKLNPRTSRVSFADPIDDIRRHCCSTEFIAYKKRSEGVSNIFYKYYFQTDLFRNRLQNVAIGTTNSHVRLSPAETLEWEVPYPPKPEQVKIAEILSTVDRAIEQTEALIAKQQRIKTGLMQDLLTRGIDEHGNLRSEETHEFKGSLLGRIPVEWKVIQLGNISQISSGLTLGKTHSGSNTIKLPYLRVANVQDGYLDLADVKKIRVPNSYCDKYQLKVGDVLMNEGGDFDKLGRGTVWRGEIDQCLHQNHVFKVRPKLGKLMPNFLAAVSSSPYGKTFFVLASKQSTNLASINSTQLKMFPIPLPDFNEQLRIENVLTQHINTIKATETGLFKLHSLKTALMQDLLTGKKRVTPLLESQAN